MCVRRHKRVPPHLGHPGTSSMGAPWSHCLKVVLRVVSVPYHPFSPIACLVVVLVRAVLSVCWFGFLSCAGSVDNVVSNSGVGMCSTPSSSGSFGVY